MPNVFLSARDPISSYTHFLGAACSAAATVLLILKITLTPGFSIPVLLACTVYGLSLIALYGASSTYHYFRGPQKQLTILRKLDHSMIYVLIAGTYTPIIAGYFTGTLAIAFVTGVWALAAAGIIIKLCWFSAPRWLYTVFYLLMGWVIVLEPSALARIPVPGIVLLLAGGVSYTAGAVIYAMKKPSITERFGFHEIFHLFVLLGSLFHLLLVLFFVA